MENVQVIEKNPGTKIAWRQDGTKIVFGDDDLTVKCATRQRDWPVHDDICMDENGNLVIGVGIGRYYVAQIDIPAKQYEEVPDPEAEEEGGGRQVPLPIDMGGVVLTLWGLDNLNV